MTAGGIIAERGEVVARGSPIARSVRLAPEVISSNSGSAGGTHQAHVVRSLLEAVSPNLKQARVLHWNGVYWDGSKAPGAT